MLHQQWQQEGHARGLGLLNMSSGKFWTHAHLEGDAPHWLVAQRPGCSRQLEAGSDARLHRVQRRRQCRGIQDVRC